MHLAWQHDWKLPVSLLDWAAWLNGALVGEGRLCCQSDKDCYLLTFLRKHMKNRWRFHQMHVQFAKGKMQLRAKGVIPWRWSFGLVVLNSLTPPEPWSWEVVTESAAQV